MEENTLVKSCYNMLYNLVIFGRQNWAHDIKRQLYSLGFGYVWEQQEVENVHDFIACFDQRLRDSYQQSWNTSKNETSKHLSLNLSRRLLKSIAKFRTMSLDIEVELGRRYGTQ